MNKGDRSYDIYICIGKHRCVSDNYMQTALKSFGEMTVDGEASCSAFRV